MTNVLKYTEKCRLQSCGIQAGLAYGDEDITNELQNEPDF